jgi:hypothetical protein
MSDPFETLRELEEQDRERARRAAQHNAEPAEPEATFERQLAQRLAAAQSRWLTLNDGSTP